jgi:hypothetical protein
MILESAVKDVDKTDLGTPKDANYWVGFIDGMIHIVNCSEECIKKNGD